MKAKTILPHSQIQELISFHVVTCPSCHHEVTPNDLCYCRYGGHVYCGKASNGCKASCPCDEYGNLYNDDEHSDAPDEDEVRRQARENVRSARLKAITRKRTFDA